MNRTPPNCCRGGRLRRDEQRELSRNYCGANMTKRIVVFGGASEIGVAIATRFARTEPCEIVLAGRPGSPHKTWAISQCETVAHVTWVDFDACDYDSHEQVIADIFTSPVDLAIVAFGVLGDSETWRNQQDSLRVAATNYLAGVSVGAHMSTHFLAQGYGSIIALSSVAAERVRRSNFVYGSSKSGMDGYYRQLGSALAPEIYTLVVRPGTVIGRMTAGRKHVPLSTTPARVADATWRAYQRGMTMVRVPRVFSLVMGVFRHAPDRLAART